MRYLLLILIEWLNKFTYKKVVVKDLDKVNKKLIKPVPKLIIDGKQYYQFVQVADMPQNRFQHYLDFREETQMGMSREDVVKYCDAIMAANNESDLSRIGSLAYMLKDSVTNCTPIEVLYNMASLVYFTEDEDVSCYDLDYNAEKIKAFKQIQDKDFFLRTLLEQTLRVSGRSLPENIGDYLRQSMVKLDTYRQMLTKDYGPETETDLKR